MRRPALMTRAALISAVVVAPNAIVATSTAVSYAATAYYVSPSGSDSAAGTLSAPWKSIAHAQSVAVAGDTVYFRGGTYSYTATSSCTSETATVNAIVLSKSGSSGGPINYVTMSNSQFQSVSTSGWNVSRQSDGSLPVLPYLRLASGSTLINKGANVGCRTTGRRLTSERSSPETAKPGVPGSSRPRNSGSAARYR